MSASPSTAVVECVPNFSEGRDPVVIEQIAAAIRAVPGVALLDIDPGKATNRTVMTMVGAPEPVLEAAFQGIKAAAALIDMGKHSGAHPRMGATDVCPFVPVGGITMAECAELARRLGQRVGEELAIPVYLYEAAASRPERQNLADIRAGEYEALPQKLQDPSWAPDFGPAAFVPRSGATVIGARPFLIAFNVNLNTKNTRKANKIGAIVREKGIARKGADGKALRDDQGELIRDPGMFPAVKAIGWYIEEYGRCQVSINFTDHTVSPPHLVVDAIRKVADDEGVVVTGCELVGLIPLDAMLAAGRHYLRRQGGSGGATEAELIEVAVQSLGLRDLGPFDADQRIVERRIRQDGPLVRMTNRVFVDTLSSSAPAPGGGSVAALCGALGAALAAMVGNLTVGKDGYQARWPAQDQMAVDAQALKEAFLTDIDRDTAAFDALMAAFALPNKSDPEKAARNAAIKRGRREAIAVPLAVLERCGAVLDAVEEALLGNENARSDAGVGALCAATCAEGAWYNVSINLRDVKDPVYKAEVRARADAAIAAVRSRAAAIGGRVRNELGAEAG